MVLRIVKITKSKGMGGEKRSKKASKKRYPSYHLAKTLIKFSFWTSKDLEIEREKRERDRYTHVEWIRVTMDLTKIKREYLYAFLIFFLIRIYKKTN